MISIISGRYGTGVSYLRLMFWTPRPTDETSSEPNLRRPRTCACAIGSATAGADKLAATVAAAAAPVMPRNARRSMLLFMALSSIFRIIRASDQVCGLAFQVIYLFKLSPMPSVGPARRDNMPARYDKHRFPGLTRFA